MKKHYREPEMEVIGLSREDMILTSGACEECPEDYQEACGCDATTGNFDYEGCNCGGTFKEEK